MSGGKETPRQKMIGMMYLVLTALLAMNTSKEVVNAFVTMDKGQQTTKEALETKIGGQMAKLSTLAGEKPVKYGTANTAVNAIHARADSMVKHINLIKAKTFAVTLNGEHAEITEDVYDSKNDVVLITLDSIKSVKGVDNYDINTHLMVADDAHPISADDPDGNNYTAVVLRSKLLVYKDFLIDQMKQVKDKDGNIIPQATTLINGLNETFHFPEKDSLAKGDGKNEEEWVVKNFYHAPLAATTAIMTTLQSNIRSAESDAIDILFNDVEGASMKFTKLKSALIPEATTVTTGAKFNAKVFLAAYDDTNIPDIFLGKPGVKYDSTKQELTGAFDKLETDAQGMGDISIPAAGIGSQHREGLIVFHPAGLPEVKKGFVLDYTVVAPTLVVSPTKMNVFYKGIPNPVSVSLPGFKNEDIVPSISNGTISKGGEGGYTVNVSSGKEANISVTATLPDGSKKTVGPVKFRVKRIPDPVPNFAKKTPADNTIKKAAFANARGLIAKMDNFDFEVSVKVSSFEMTFVKDGTIITKKSNSNKVTSEMQANMKKVRSGEKVFIENIKVKMPDGTTRKVGNMALKVVN